MCKSENTFEKITQKENAAGCSTGKELVRQGFSWSVGKAR